MRARPGIIVLVGALATRVVSSAAEIHVHEGDSIQAAIDIAGPGDEVVVHPGIYLDNLDMSGKAITLRSTDPGDPAVVSATIVDGGGSGTVVTCDTSETAATTISGLTIANGSAANGGGMLIAAAGPTVLSCTIRDNGADFGGGVFNSSGTPVFVECVFEGNTAGTSGGGMYNYALSGQPGAEFVDCRFISNTAESNGGGMRNWDSSPTLVRCTFDLNHVRRHGAGMANGGTSHPALTGCMFQFNRADTLFASWNSHGGGVYNADDASPTLLNCVFRANSAHASLPAFSHGGAIANTGQARPRIVNCTLVANDANFGDGLYSADAAVPVIANSILWDSEDAIVIADDAWADVRYSNVQGGWPGPGNISADPMLDDLELLPGSPCIDAGHDRRVPIDADDFDRDGKACELFPVDFNGLPRFVDDPAVPDTGCGPAVIVDMGASEFQEAGTAAEVIAADTDGNGRVDFDDLLAVLSTWGPAAACAPADLDVSGAVDLGDLLEVLARWGRCPRD